jgi:hypothetical protein
MPRLLSAFVFSTAVPVLAQALPVAPQSPESILPASTYAVLRFGGLGACRTAANAMPAAAAVHDFLAKVPAEVRARHLEGLLDRAAEELQAGCEDMQLRPADLRAAFGRPMALAVGRVSIEGWGPSVALVIDTGEHRRVVNRLVQWGAQLVAQHAGVAESGEVEIGGSQFHSLLLQEGPSLFAGAVGKFYVVSNSRGLLRDLLGVQSGQQPGLTAATRLGTLQGELPVQALASLFVNTAPLMASVAPHLPYEASDWADALGLGACDAVYWASGAGEQGGADLLHLGVGGSERGLCKVLLSTPADLGGARALSPNTVAFGAASLDVDGLVAAFERFSALLPANAREEMTREMHRELGRELAHVGTSPAELRKLLAAFGSQVTVALALEKGAVPKPELLVRVAVRDADVVARLLQQIERATGEHAGLQWKSRDVDGRDVRFCSVQADGMPFQLSPCYSLAKDAVWIGSDAAALVRALRQDPAESLAEQPDFQQLVAQSRGASGVMHWRLFRAAEIGWRTVETMLYPQLDAHQDEIGFGSEALPDAETMARALGCSTSIWHVGKDGVTVQGRGIFASGSLLAAMGAVADEILARASGKVY